MILFLRNPENFTLISNSVYQVKESKIGCEECPDCSYYVNNQGKKYKIQNCNKHKKATN